MNLKIKWGYILTFLVAVHLQVQINAQGNQKKILKAIRNLLDEKMTDFLENKMPIILEDKLPKIVGEKIEEYVMERFDTLEEHFGKLIDVCNSNCTSGNCTCDQDSNGYQCNLVIGNRSGAPIRPAPTTLSPSTTMFPLAPTSLQPAPTTISTKALSTECQDGFFRMTNSSRCFKVLYDEKASFESAQIRCQQMGLELAKNIDDIAIPLRKHLLDTFGDYKDVWINARGSGKDDGNYIWQQQEEDQQQQQLDTVDKSLMAYNGTFPGSTGTCLILLVTSRYWNPQPRQPYGTWYCDRTWPFPLCESSVQIQEPTTSLPCSGFKCTRREKEACIDLDWKCDGVQDCDDNSDEFNCKYSTLFTAE